MWVLGSGKQLIHSEHQSLWSWSYTLRLKSIGWTVLKICRTHTDRDSVHLYSIRFSNPIISVHWTVDSMSFHPQSWCLYDLLGLEKEPFNHSYCDAVLYCLMFNGVKSLSIIVYMIKDNIQAWLCLSSNSSVDHAGECWLKPGLRKSMMSKCLFCFIHEIKAAHPDIYIISSRSRGSGDHQGSFWDRSRRSPAKSVNTASQSF